MATEQKRTKTIFRDGTMLKATPEQNNLLLAIEDDYLPWAAVQAAGGAVPDELFTFVNLIRKLMVLACPDGHTAELLNKNVNSANIIHSQSEKTPQRQRIDVLHSIFELT